MADKDVKDYCKTCSVEPPAMRFKCPECEHNPDKEQIIIDGVDVSGCVSFDKLNGQNICCYEDTREDKIPFANFCVENKDCYFKQLARKTQEYEQLQEKYEALKLENQEGYEIVAELKQECEELKKKLRKFELENTTLQNRYQQVAGATTEAAHYLKALEEIEENIKSYCKDMCMAETKETCEICHNTNILAIIDMVKRGSK